MPNADRLDGLDSRQLVQATHAGQAATGHLLSNSLSVFFDPGAEFLQLPGLGVYGQVVLPDGTSGGDFDLRQTGVPDATTVCDFYGHTLVTG